MQARVLFGRSIRVFSSWSFTHRVPRIFAAYVPQQEAKEKAAQERIDGKAAKDKVEQEKTGAVSECSNGAVEEANNNNAEKEDVAQGKVTKKITRRRGPTKSTAAGAGAGAGASASGSAQKVAARDASKSVAKLATKSSAKTTLKTSKTMSTDTGKVRGSGGTRAEKAPAKVR